MQGLLPQTRFPRGLSDNGEYPIETAIDTSKRTLCLLTRNFFTSNYCQTEFMLAYHREVHLGRRRLIALLDDRVDFNSDDISAEMRSYMTVYTYIDKEQTTGLTSCCMRCLSIGC